MGTLSKTADAARKAVAKGEQKAKVERTTAQILKDIRNHLESGLAVTPNDVRVLLAEYDKLYHEVMANRTGLQVLPLPDTIQEALNSGDGVYRP